MSHLISEAVRYIVLRNEDGNLLNNGLNELESELFLLLDSNGKDTDAGLEALQQELISALTATISCVAKKYGLVDTGDEPKIKRKRDGH